MRFDIVSVFPEFFSALDLSLVGRARSRGIIDLATHDLRDWTTDVHRTVDDSPFGGGAGMVMKPDIWAKAIDDVVVPGNTVLAIPTPSGVPLTQEACWELARADQIVIACGRYEGIDSRVAEYYAAQGLDVFEYSLGDYVLNGGEVAAVALVEAVSRLLPGMVGNPESLREESHGEDGLLEYPVYTRPTSFRGLNVPQILTSGDHGKVARWRRDRALERTAARRPDMIAALELEALDKKDRAALSRLGWYAPGGATSLQQAQISVVSRGTTQGPAPDMAAEPAVALSELATRLFVDACPPALTEKDIRAFTDAKLAPANFERYLADGEYLVLAAVNGGWPVAYALVALNSPADAGQPEAAALAGLPDQLVYLSKVYVERAWRGTGLFEALMRKTLAEIAAKVGPATVWLGTHQGNRRAQNAYRKAGFKKVGERTFIVGEQPNTDVTMARAVGVEQ